MQKARKTDFFNHRNQQISHTLPNRDDFQTKNLHETAEVFQKTNESVARCRGITSLLFT